MEMKGIKHMMLHAGVICLMLFFTQAHSQEMAYTVKDGKMYIQLPKKISESELDSFISHFDLADLDLKRFIKTGITDSLRKLGWNININNETGIIISKPLFAIDDITNPGNKIIFSNEHNRFSPIFPAVSNSVVYGHNRIRNRHPFAVKDSIVRFFIRDRLNANKLMLAGSFNNWSPDALAMTRTDSGWIADVVLSPGKYWYKFIADGHWMVDPDNREIENDGQGNDNSVYFKTNMVFTLDAHTKAKQVFLAGSFNDWNSKSLPMIRTATGWTLPLYLADGTHRYKFVVDGRQWYQDEKNPDKLPDGAGGFNSVVSIGKPHLFKLPGFENARQVMVAGSFNQWRDFEFSMKKVDGGWELPLVINAGNHEYKFKVDDQWVSDPSNPVVVRDGNSYLVKEPNYTFRLKGYPHASQVLLAGDFNGWDPSGIPMKKEGDDWVVSLHLSPGKVRYKFIVDKNWILDPGNKQWEQNENMTGNSVIWIEH